MQIVHDYKDDARLRKSFNRLAKLVFGIDFEAWYQKGFWDEKYICHSLVDNELVLSNVSTSKMDLILHGKRKRAMQIGTVMTHPDYQKKGFADSLMKAVLDRYQNEVDFFYLFPNDSVMDFYPRYGFKASHDSYYLIEMKTRPGSRPGLVKANMGEDLELERFYRAVQSRKQVSSTFDTQGCESIYMWHCMYDLSDHIYRIKGRDDYLIYSKDERSIRLFDLVASRHYDLSYMFELMGLDAKKDIQLFICPDELQDERWTKQEIRNEELFFRPEIAMSGFPHPRMART